MFNVFKGVCTTFLLSVMILMKVGGSSLEKYHTQQRRESSGKEDQKLSVCSYSYFSNAVEDK